MPRSPRQRARSGCYHVMLRGVNKQRIFEDKKDFERFVRILKRICIAPDCELYAYCLMENHVHLLLHEGQQNISDLIKRIASSYALYYNLNHERVGHLFQDRFRSEPVDDSHYLRTLYRYIYANPVKGGLCQHPADYRWSSYKEMITRKKIRHLCVSPAPVFGIEPPLEFDPNEFLSVSLTEESDLSLNLHTISYTLLQLSNCTTISEFQRMTKQDQQPVLYELHRQGASYQQLSRITGLTLGTVRGSCSREKQQIQPTTEE